MVKPAFVLIHGWGLNEAVWTNIIPALSEVYEVHLISLAGYGIRQAQPAANSIDELTNDLLSQVPKRAIWCGWSLGGIAAIAAAIKAPDRVLELKLLCTTPKYVASENWTHGKELAVFTKFAQDLAANYNRGIKRFLLLQAGSLGEAKRLASEASIAIDKLPSPTPQTLMSGLRILEQADLRTDLKHVKVPTQVISAARDRIIPSEAGKYLAEHIPEASFHEINSGHAPHLSHADELLTLLCHSTTN